MVYPKRILSTLIAGSLFFLSYVAQAEVLFEGYSKVLLGGIHVGYYVSKYEYDAKKKQFVAAYFLKTNEFGGNISESLKATANEKLEPISYSYTTMAGKEVKTIDATFSKGRMRATMNNNGKTEKIDNEFPKGAFLSSFLAYVMLKSPKGLQTGVKYEYQAIAEEDANIYKGLAYVKELEEFKGIRVFKILNDFKNVKFISFATEKGEMLATKSPVTSIATEVVAEPSEATAGFSPNLGSLKTLFGLVPMGRTNAIVQFKALQPQAPIQSPPVPPSAPAQPAGK